MDTHLIIFKTLFGSRLYGTATPTSDVDYKAIALPRAAELLRNEPPRIQQHESNPEDAAREETEIFPLRRYVELLLEGQTVALDMMFAPKDLWVGHPSWQWCLLHDNRHRFLHAGMESFVGYCRAQAQKYGFKGKRILTLETVLAALQVLPPQDPLSAHREMFAALESRHDFLSAQDALHLEVCGRLFPWGAKVILALQQCGRILEGYGRRARSAAASQGQDWKAMMHAVRVAREGEELLTTGHITFPRPERELLLRIRRGEMAQEQVEEIIEESLARIEEARRNTVLPPRPDTEWAEELVTHIHAQSLRAECLRPLLCHPQQASSDAPRLVFLGTASGLPTLERNVSSVALVLRGGHDIWLFDCGEGTQRQLTRHGLSPSSVRNIFVTHMHGDHVLGLVPLLSSLGLAHGDALPRIFAPAGCEAWIRACAQACQIPSLLSLKVQELESGMVHADERARVRCMPVPHRVSAFGYRVDFSTPSPNVDMEKLAREGIPPGPWLGSLKKGQDAALPDGRHLHPSDYLLPPAEPLSFALSGDKEGEAPAFTAFVKGVHTLIHESTYRTCHEENARTWGHSTAAMAARTARDAQVERLVLTHFSARYGASDLHAMLCEAREVFPHTHLAADGLAFGFERRNRHAPKGGS